MPPLISAIRLYSHIRFNNHCSLGISIWKHIGSVAVAYCKSTMMLKLYWFDQTCLGQKSAKYRTFHKSILYFKRSARSSSHSTLPSLTITDTFLCSCNRRPHAFIPLFIPSAHTYGIIMMCTAPGRIKDAQRRLQEGLEERSCGLSRPVSPHGVRWICVLLPSSSHLPPPGGDQG